MTSTEEDLTLEEPLDPRVEEAFGEFLELRNQGLADDPIEFIARYPTIADELRACLRGIGIAVPEVAQRPDALQHIGPYHLIRVIGRGGMGVVYEARGPANDLRLALKVLNVNLRGQGRTAKRFEREAETLRNLDHPNIVPVLDAGVDGELLYYVMPLVEGRSLDRFLDDLRDRDGRAAAPELSAEETWYGTEGGINQSRAAPTQEAKRAGGIRAARTGRMDPRRRADIIECRNTARFFVEVCDALQHAHSRNIIHRDIKPANLILDEENRLRITDFGLAKRQDVPSMTQSGDLIGTPMYMSPEQAMAKRIPVDHRTDIYSLGATMYECLAFTPPFEGSTTAEVLRQVISKEPVRLSRHNTNVPLPLEAIVHRALEKDPDLRYQTAALMGQDLQRYLAGRPVDASFPSWSKRLLRRAQRQPVQAALVGAIALMTILLVASWSLGILDTLDPQRERLARLETIDKSLATGSWSQAELDLIEAWPDADDRPIEARVRWSQLLWRTRRNAAAYDELRRCGPELAGFPAALRLRIALHAFHGVHTPLLEDLKHCQPTLALRSEDMRLEWLGAIAAGALDHAESVIAWLERQRPEQALRARLWLDVERGRLAAAGEVLEALERRYPGTSGLAWPRWLERRGEIQAATESLERLIAERLLSREEQELAQLWLGDWLLRSTPPHADLASESLRKAVDSGVGYPARVAYAAARRAARRPSSEEADFLLQRLESEYPDLALAKRVRAEVLLDAGHLGRARQLVNRALEVDPADPQTRWVGIWIELCDPTGRGDLGSASSLLAPIATAPGELTSAIFWGALIDTHLTLATPAFAVPVIEDAINRLYALDPERLNGRIRAYQATLQIWLHLLDPRRPPVAWTGSGKDKVWNREGASIQALPFSERIALLRSSVLMAERLEHWEGAELLSAQATQLSNSWLDRFAAARIAAWREAPQAALTLTALAAEADPASEPNVRARIFELWSLTHQERAMPREESIELERKRNELLQYYMSEFEMTVLALAEIEILKLAGRTMEASIRGLAVSSPQWFHRPLANAVRALTRNS